MFIIVMLVVANDQSHSKRQENTINDMDTRWLALYTRALASSWNYVHTCIRFEWLLENFNWAWRKSHINTVHTANSFLNLVMNKLNTLTFEGFQLEIELRCYHSRRFRSSFSFVNCQFNWSQCVRPLDWSQKVYSIHLNAYSNRIKLYADLQSAKVQWRPHFIIHRFIQVKWIFEQENQLTWSTFEFPDRFKYIKWANFHLHRSYVNCIHIFHLSK